MSTNNIENDCIHRSVFLKSASHEVQNVNDHLDEFHGLLVLSLLAWRASTRCISVIDRFLLVKPSNKRC